MKVGTLVNKKLYEMSLEELWTLFPIYLTEHKDYWTQWYEEEKFFLLLILSEIQIARISHVGSTAVHTIWAKPIIDILLEIKLDQSFEIVEETLTKNGYLVMNKDKNRFFFNKGYTENGFSKKVFHLHLRYIGDNDELYFRDYLNAKIEPAKEYEALKLKLWKEFEHDRDSYTNQKTELITTYTDLAKELFNKRYQ